MQHIVLGQPGVTWLVLLHGDMYPVGAPDGVINTLDLILLLKVDSIKLKAAISTLTRCDGFLIGNAGFRNPLFQLFYPCFIRGMC